MGAPVAEADLDWYEFVAANFPGSGRHDLRALVAYGDYKRSRARRKAPGMAVERGENAAEDRTALETWEDEGGHPS